MRLLLLAAIIFSQGPRLFAAQSSSAQFLNLGFGARALGMGEAFPVELPNGATIGDLIQTLSLPESEIKIVFVNGLYRGRTDSLTDGDEVGIFPPVGGG